MCEYSFKQQYLFLLKEFKSRDTGHSDTSLGSCHLTREQLLSDIDMMLKTNKGAALCTSYFLNFFMLVASFSFKELHFIWYDSFCLPSFNLVQF